MSRNESAVKQLISVLFVNLKIRAEIQYFQDNSLQNEKDHGSFLADIEEKQATLQSEAEEYEKQAAKLENILGNVKAGVWKSQW